jgi:hypothetical protein
MRREEDKNFWTKKTRHTEEDWAKKKNVNINIGFQQPQSSPPLWLAFIEAISRP